jgi:hypothetical protein
MDDAPATWSSAQKRSVLLEHRFRIDNRNIGDICAKYDIGKSAFQRLRKEMGHPFAAEEELVIAGVYEGAHSVQSLQGYLDYRNHAGYRAAEVLQFLANLVQIGVLVRRDDHWHFAPGTPAANNRFVFTAPPGAAHEPIHFGRLRHPALR